MKFRYYKFHLKKPSKILGKFVLRPIIPIRLRFKDKDIRYATCIGISKIPMQ